ncbi:MAG: hypothetical protein ACI4WT_04130 [Oligosphaeraceae bacterium]
MGMGLATGFAAALFLALSYVFSGMSVRRFAGVSPVSLLCRSHLVMGALSLVGLACVWSPAVVTGFGSYAWPLAGAVGFYLLGQSGLFMAQRAVDASRVVPLLGLKLLVLALVNMHLLPLLGLAEPERYGAWQWLGMGLTVVSAFLLNQAGGRIAWGGLCWIGVTCLGYALSDTCIKRLMDVMQGLLTDGGAVRNALLSAFLCYVLAAVVSAALLPLLRLPRGVRAARVWGWLSPFAVCWLLAMLFLYLCFHELGTVNGNIIQSTRGLLAIMIGWTLSRAGFTELETAISARVLVRRLFAGALMVAAIVLFNLT